MHEGKLWKVHAVNETARESPSDYAPGTPGGGSTSNGATHAPTGNGNASNGNGASAAGGSGNGAESGGTESPESMHKCLFDDMQTLTHNAESFPRVCLV